jgi:hypothetical protein
MKRVTLIPFAIVFLSALLPVAALGKGASQAEIIGPGLADPIVLAGEGQPGGERLMRIAEGLASSQRPSGRAPIRCWTQGRQEVWGPATGSRT